MENVKFGLLIGGEQPWVLAKDCVKLTIQAEKDGYEARILQHEIDHLSGKLFVDYLSSLKRNMLIKRVKKLKKMGEI